ncbi:hypothetical protein ACOMHN_047792 [Nucella lapillus]
MLGFDTPLGNFEESASGESCRSSLLVVVKAAGTGKKKGRTNSMENRPHCVQGLVSDCWCGAVVLSGVHSVNTAPSALVCRGGREGGRDSAGMTLHSVLTPTASLFTPNYPPSPPPPTTPSFNPALSGQPTFKQRSHRLLFGGREGGRR